ncbi:flagellar motor protein MotB [Frateuria sp. STR12]|uniref:flagellar motor protein MotB n=1 Tax=Frateuria hangzhouensis TaxID=2995589 RepID=UPI002260BC41|nr:flagellar motor protein MotB [Frateuria sp. STR12]MCX7514878.1 flagellar motor protein MotB [Frateuria sp. STR12]
MSEGGGPPIIIKRVKKQAHGHHGGAWKVAYADFVTAMMAFFLVMWILGAGTREQKAAISEYFRNPSMTPGNATVAPPGQMGPGGASDAAVQLGGAMDLSHGPGKDRHNGPSAPVSKEALEQRARAQEKARLQELMEQLHAAIQNSQALAPFKDQLLLDITSEGLRIQIVDKLNRPMFDLGSAQLKDYTRAILGELGDFINRVPNRISITGHTDDAPYADERDYSNWELSTDRANAARRALLAGGMLDGKTARVLGLAASVPLDKAHPANPINRRISIIVMTKAAEAAALSQDVVDIRPPLPGKAPTAATQAAPAPTADIVPPAAEPTQGAPPGNLIPASEPVAITALPIPPTLRPAGR